MVEKADKPAKAVPVFDADQPFGLVGGVPGVVYAQGGNWFNAHGTFVSKAR